MLFHLTEAELFMTDALISVGDGEKVTLSDHYGINIVLAKSKSQSLNRSSKKDVQTNFISFQ